MKSPETEAVFGRLLQDTQTRYRKKEIINQKQNKHEEVDFFNTFRTKKTGIRGDYSHRK